MFSAKYFEFSRASTFVFLLAAPLEWRPNQLTLDYAIFDSSSFVKGNSHTREIYRKRRRGVFWTRSINLNGLYSSSSISAHAEFPEDQPIEEIHCILEPKVLASRRHRAWRPRFVQIGKKLLKAGFKVS